MLCLIIYQEICLKQVKNPRNSESGVPTPIEFRLNMFDKLEELDEKFSSTGSDFTGESGADGCLLKS